MLGHSSQIRYTFQPRLVTLPHVCRHLRPAHPQVQAAQQVPLQCAHVCQRMRAHICLANRLDSFAATIPHAAPSGCAAEQQRCVGMRNSHAPTAPCAKKWVLCTAESSPFGTEASPRKQQPLQLQMVQCHASCRSASHEAAPPKQCISFNRVRMCSAGCSAVCRDTE